MNQPDSKMKLYRAMIWVPDSALPGQRVSVFAENLKDAKEKLEAEYGQGSVFDLHNEAEATQLR